MDGFFTRDALLWICTEPVAEPFPGGGARAGPTTRQFAGGGAVRRPGGASHGGIPAAAGGMLRGRNLT